MAASYDSIIIGAGPAGQQAGLFLGRATLKTLLIGDPESSDLSYGKIIGNLFGAPDDPSGATLLRNGVGHLKRCGTEVLPGEVVDIVQAGDAFEVVTAALERFAAKTIVIATGRQLPTAGIRNERDFLGKGVHTCVACDGPLFKDKVAAVVGSGPHAAEEALELSAYTGKITIYSQGEPWTMGEGLLRRLEERGLKREDKRIARIAGETFVRSVEFADKTSASVDGVFLAVGSAGGVTFANKLGLVQDKDGYLAIDRDGRTNLPGIWAAGSVTGGNAQIAKSVGEGCNAAISIIKTLKGLAEYVDQK